MWVWAKERRIVNLDLIATAWVTDDPGRWAVRAQEAGEGRATYELFASETQVQCMEYLESLYLLVMGEKDDDPIT